ncbi:MAG: SAM-dependent methyltransferase [Limnothrix sp. RL_2_0]|nr:SAM-dependent methyltransferase [Limnothrix sp. RL_2_0]
MELKSIVPWGRSLAEYVAMFNLTEANLQQKILGCGDGPASFNTELTKLGGDVISIDPIYAFSAQEISEQIQAVYPEIKARVSQNLTSFVWSQFDSVEDLCEIRMQTMSLFLEDYGGRNSGDRHQNQALPKLSFSDKSFDLALCSHLLFLYSQQLDAAMHIASILELCRVAKEVRIYPLVTLSGELSSYLDFVRAELLTAGIKTELKDVDYEFQRGATQMLVAKWQ